MIRASLSDDGSNETGWKYHIEYLSTSDLKPIKKWLKNELPSGVYIWKNLKITKRLVLPIKNTRGKYSTAIRVVKISLLEFVDKSDAALFKLFWGEIFTDKIEAITI